MDGNGDSDEGRREETVGGEERRGEERKYIKGKFTWSLCV